MIVLWCPKCKREMEADAEDTDPPGTAVVATICNLCDDGGGFPETHYYDAEGRWYGPDGWCVSISVAALTAAMEDKQ